MSTSRVAIVTAASKGIGAACARELRARGYELALLARHDDVHAVAGELGGIAVTGSVTDEAALRALVDAAIARWGRIDVVVGNTGHPAKGNPLELGDDDWRAGYELILGSAIRLARLVTPIMRAQHAGAFVHVSSYAAVRPDVARPVSTVFRAALGAWVELHAKSVAARASASTRSYPALSIRTLRARTSSRRSRWGGSAGSTSSPGLLRSSHPTTRRTSPGSACSSTAR